MRLLIQLRPAAEIVAAVADPAVTVSTSDVIDELPGFVLDRSFAPVAVPRPTGTDQLSYSLAPTDASVLVRGEIADEEAAAAVAALSRSRTVTGVFADPVIQTSLTCGDNPAVGNWQDVGSLLHVEDLAAAGLTGAAVALAIVDTGINAKRVTQVRGGGRPRSCSGSLRPAGDRHRRGELGRRRRRGHRNLRRPAHRAEHHSLVEADLLRR